MCADLLAATKDLPKDVCLEFQKNQHALSEIFGIENPRHVRI